MFQINYKFDLHLLSGSVWHWTYFLGIAVVQGRDFFISLLVIYLLYLIFFVQRTVLSRFNSIWYFVNQIVKFIFVNFKLHLVLMMEHARHSIHPMRRTRKPSLLRGLDNCLESLSTHLDLYMKIVSDQHIYDLKKM